MELQEGVGTNRTYAYGWMIHIWVRLFMDSYINEDTYIDHVMNIKVNQFQSVLLDYCLYM